MVRCFKGVLLGNAVVGDVKEVPHCVDEIVKTGNLVPAEIEAKIHEQRLSRDNLVVVDIVDQGSADTTVIEQIVVLLEVVHDVVAERDKLLDVQIGDGGAGDLIVAMGLFDCIKQVVVETFKLDVDEASVAAKEHLDEVQQENACGQMVDQELGDVFRQHELALKNRGRLENGPRNLKVAFGKQGGVRERIKHFQNILDVVLLVLFHGGDDVLIRDNHFELAWFHEKPSLKIKELVKL